jgi:hypothetical protein
MGLEQFVLHLNVISLILATSELWINWSPTLTITQTVNILGQIILIFVCQAHLIITLSWFPVDVQVGPDNTLSVQTASRAYVYDMAAGGAWIEEQGSIPWESFSCHHYLTEINQPRVVVELADGRRIMIQPLYPDEFVAAVNGTNVEDVP